MEHKTYELSAVVTVSAISEADAVLKAEALIALIPGDTLGSISIEDASIYVADDYDDVRE